MKKMEMVKEQDSPSQLSPTATTGVTTPHLRQSQLYHNIDIESESPTKTFLSKHRCCFTFPCFGSPHQTTRNSIRLGTPTTPSSLSSPISLWDKIQAAENERKWWTKPIKAFKKLREWSEIVAGPKWKTFIRRFNRNGCKGYQNVSNGNTINGKQFQYDPLSYALNFDEGNRGNDQFDEEDFGYYPDFTSRFVKVSSVNSKKSGAAMDLGHNKIAPAG